MTAQLGSGSIGLSFNGGGSFSGTNTFVQASLANF